MEHSTEDYKGYKIIIKYDEDPMDPRSNDNIGKMICFHKRYDLGDNHDYDSNDYSGWDELREQLIKDFRNDVILPLYLYDHSGITMNTTGFSCRWDSGQVGFIVVDREMLLALRGVKKITKKEREKLFEYLKSEVEEYDNYITGDAYGYVIEDEDEEEVDSCWGYLGDANYALSEAKSIIDHLVKQSTPQEQLTETV